MATGGARVCLRTGADPRGGDAVGAGPHLPILRAVDDVLAHHNVVVIPGHFVGNVTDAGAEVATAGLEEIADEGGGESVCAWGVRRKCD